MPVPRPDPGWDVFARELGHNLHRLRLARGLTQEEIAYSAGMSRYTYQKFDKGLSSPDTPANPNIRNVMALAQLLGVTLDELVPGDWPDLRGGR